MASDDLPEFLRMEGGAAPDLVAEVPDWLRAQRTDPSVPSEGERWWHHLDQQFNFHVSPDSRSQAWDRGEYGNVLCNHCRTKIGVVLDVKVAVVLGLLVDNRRYGRFLLLAFDEKVDPEVLAALRQACGEVPTTAPCPRHGERPLAPALEIFRNHPFRPGRRPPKKTSQKV